MEASFLYFFTFYFNEPSKVLAFSFESQCWWLVAGEWNDPEFQVARPSPNLLWTFVCFLFRFFAVIYNYNAQLVVGGSVSFRPAAVISTGKFEPGINYRNLIIAFLKRSVSTHPKTKPKHSFLLCSAL